MAALCFIQIVHWLTRDVIISQSTFKSKPIYKTPACRPRLNVGECDVHMTTLHEYYTNWTSSTSAIDEQVIYDNSGYDNNMNPREQMIRGGHAPFAAPPHRPTDVTMWQHSYKYISRIVSLWFVGDTRVITYN